MKALVTGGAGFLGYHLARELAGQGHEVVICDNLFRGKMDDDFAALLDRPNVSFVKIDLTDQKKLDELPTDIDAIFHMAAINGTRYFYEIPYTVARTNLLTSINVLDWMGSTNCRKLVWPSSSEVYAGGIETQSITVPTPEKVPLTISDVTNPRFSYAGSKIAGEILTWNYAKSNNYTVTIIRPHNIYGPRMGYEHVIPEFIVRILDEKNPFPIFGTDQSRAFCYVDDFVQGVLLSAEIFSDEEVRIINIGNDEEVIIGELAERLFSISNFHPTLDKHPSPEGSVHRRCPDISFAREILGYVPKVQLDEGLRLTYEWYVSHYQAEPEV